MYLLIWTEYGEIQHLTLQTIEQVNSQVERMFIDITKAVVLKIEGATGHKRLFVRAHTEIKFEVVEKKHKTYFFTEE